VGANLGAVSRICLVLLVAGLASLAAADVWAFPASDLGESPTAMTVPAAQPLERNDEIQDDLGQPAGRDLPQRGGAGGAVRDTESSVIMSKLDADLRFRGSQTANLGNLQAGQDAARSGFFDRMRLGANFSTPSITAYMQLQASGAFGDSGVNLTPLPIGLQQGVIQLRVPGVNRLDLNVGRMTLAFGAGRMIGRYDFHESGHAFDGIVAHVGVEKVLDLHAIAVKIRRNIAQPDDERNMGGIYLQTTPFATLQADVYFLYLLDNSTDAAGKKEKDKLLTMGTRINWQPTLWFEFEGEAAVQVGELKQDVQLDRQDLLATALIGQLTLKRESSIAQRLTLHGQMYSGDAKPTDRVLTTWRPLYPSLDEVVGLLQLVNQTNLLQVGIRYRAQLSALTSAEIDGRAFASEGGTTLPGFGEKFLVDTATWHTTGAELDFRMRWQWRPRTEFLLAAGMFAPSDALCAIGQRLAGQVLLQWSSRF